MVTLRINDVGKYTTIQIPCYINNYSKFHVFPYRPMIPAIFFFAFPFPYSLPRLVLFSCFESINNVIILTINNVIILTINNFVTRLLLV